MPAREWLLISLVVAIMVGRWVWVWARGPRAERCWNRAVQAYENGDMASAARLFEKCVRLVPVWVLPRRMLGRALASQGKLDQAEEHFRFAVQLEPRAADNYVDWGSFLAICRPQRTDEALDAFAKAVELDPEMRTKLARLDHLAPLRTQPRFAALLGPDQP